jgi:hypothetical protein
MGQADFSGLWMAKIELYDRKVVFKVRENSKERANAA